MNTRLRNFILAVIAGYLTLLFFVSAQLANFSLALFLVLMVPVLIVRHIIMDNLYKRSINIVARQFVLSPNSLHNEHCTVIYTPDEKIVVMDNLSNKQHAKRMFTITKSKVNINKAWNRVCRIFDSFISLDALASFYSYDTKIEIVTLESKIPDIRKPKTIEIDASNQGPKFVELDNIQPDPYSKGTENPNDTGASFVNLENIQERQQEIKREDKTPDFVELEDVLSNTSNKIDVNAATSSELSILPGINIVMAKKIIEYRDKNGLFASKEDFIEAANVKDHFIPKIKQMIIIGKPEDKSDGDDYYEGRIVDL